MIIYESLRYRIEQHSNTPLQFSVDYKDRSNNRVALVNIGWCDWRHKAFQLMNNHAMELEARVRKMRI